MSKERELLKECRLMLDNPFNGTAGLILRNRIDDYFDQPEQLPNNPEPFMFKDRELTGSLTAHDDMYKKGYAQAQLDLSRAKLLERDNQISKLVEENSKLREDLREEISLRDHFAGLTLQGTLARACPNVDTIAQFAYGIADKMMAEREKDLEEIKSQASGWLSSTDGSYEACLNAMGYYTLQKKIQLEELSNEN